jgi:radical SAM superfamily enzyme YgiQ (UPF0313 family)
MDERCSEEGTRKFRLALVSIPYGEGPQLIMPLGLMNIAGYIQGILGDKVEARIFDYSDADPDDTKPTHSIGEWLPDAVGFSIYSSHVMEAVNWGKRLKKILPKAQFFAGGPHVSLDVQRFIKKWGRVFRFGVVGDGEIPVATALRVMMDDPELEAGSLARIPNIAFMPDPFQATGEEDVKWTEKAPALPPEEWPNPLVPVYNVKERFLAFTDRVDNRIRKAVALTSSRGCPMACSFCSIISMNNLGPRWRACTADQLLSWLLEEYQVNKFEHVYLMDANFFVKQSRVRDFAKGLSELMPGVTWSTSSTINYIIQMRNDFPILVEQGLRLVEIGIESGSNKQLKYLNKAATAESNREAVSILQKNGIEIGLDYIMFYPDQEAEEIRDNLTFLVRSRLTQQETFDHYFNMLTLYPGTPLRQAKELELDAEFDSDVLPNSAELIKDARVKWIYSKFIDEFGKSKLCIVDDCIHRVQERIRELRQSDGNLREIAKLRLRMVFLRHIPFKILWSLVACNFEGQYCGLPYWEEAGRQILSIESSLTTSKKGTAIA